MQSGSVRVYKMCHMSLGLLRTCVWLLCHFITCCKWLSRLTVVYNEKQHNQAHRMVRSTECLSNIMYGSNGSFNISPPPPQAFEIIIQIPPYPSQNAVQMPHTRVYSGDQMPPPRGHFTGAWMTEGRKKRFQLSSKIFINTANNSHSI